jgi:uroporphyrinogen-III synthase
MPAPRDQVLAGRLIAVTRPAEQAASLCAAIRAAGGSALCFPVLAISALDDTTALRAVAARLDDYQLAFFVSPNAVHHALDVLLAEGPWPSGVAVATVGKGSERALAERGLRDVIAPQQGFDSEAVLALPAFAPQAVRGRRVAIFRGDGGRDLLGETLKAYGATVDYITCYRRGLPALDADLLRAPAARGELDAISLTSSEGVRNLLVMLGGALPAALAAVPVFASHPRIGAAAREAGFHQVVECEPGDEGLMRALATHFNSSLG